jgi:hypothetical protein
VTSSGDCDDDARVPDGSKLLFPSVCEPRTRYISLGRLALAFAAKFVEGVPSVLTAPAVGKDTFKPLGVTVDPR